MFDDLEKQHFDKIKYQPSKEKGRVTFTVPRAGGEKHKDEIPVKIGDLPHPDLRRALNRLTDQYLDILDLPEDLGDRVVVIGMEITSHNPPEIVVYGKRDLTSGQTIGQATPSESPISNDIMSALDEVVDEAIMYAQGKRANLNLFEEYGPEGKAEDAPEDAEQIEKDSGVEDAPALES